MASKKKIPVKKQITRGISHTTNEVALAVDRFTNILNGLMPISEIIEKAQLIQNECGPDAKIELSYDDYFGASIDFVWHRLETDEEFTKRLDKAEKAKVAGKAAAKIRKAKKEKDELADLARLQKKYGNKGD